MFPQVFHPPRSLPGALPPSLVQSASGACFKADPQSCHVLKGYNRPSRIETEIGRWKSVIGPRLQFHSLSRPITKIKPGQKVLNTMSALRRPVFERTA